MTYVAVLPVAFGAFLAGFSVAFVNTTPAYALALSAMLLANIILLVVATALPCNRTADTRVLLSLSPIFAGLLLLAFFWEPAVGPSGSLMDKPWSFAWATQLLIGSGWLALWLPKDYLDHDEVANKRLFLQMSHDEYQASLNPAVVVAVTAFVAGVLQVAQSATPSANGGRSMSFGLLQSIVVLLAGVCMTLPVIRILSHISATRWLLATLDLSSASEAESVASAERTEARTERQTPHPRHAILAAIADVLVVIASYLRK